MQTAHVKERCRFFLLRVLIASLLLILLGACGTSSPASSVPTQSHVGNTTKTATSNLAKTATGVAASDPLNLNTANLTVQLGNLLIQSSGGFQCPYNSGHAATPGQLVFTSDPITYSQAEIAQIRSYVNSNFLTSPPPPPPPLLRWVLGGSMGLIVGKPGRSICGASLMLTNTGNTPIQIPKVGVQLKTSPQQNAYQYRLIDVCSLWPPSKTGIGECPPTAGGGGNCNYYYAEIQLGLGEQNTVFSTAPFAGNGRGGPPCGTLTLAPAAQDTLTFDFSPAPNIPMNLMYSMVPIFTVDTGQGEQTLALPQLGSTLAFASASQFSCYGLQGTAFVSVSSSSSGPTWCV